MWTQWTAHSDAILVCREPLPQHSSHVSPNICRSLLTDYVSPVWPTVTSDQALVFKPGAIFHVIHNVSNAENSTYTATLFIFPSKTGNLFLLVTLIFIVFTQVSPPREHHPAPF